MVLLNLNFYLTLFFLISIISSIMVIVSKNPLHSIIYLILVFCNIVFILLLQEIEFLSMVFLIVYIGAIAVLFLFVIYMLNLKIIELNELNWQYSIGILFSLISLIKLIIFFLNKDFNFINYYYNNIDYIKFFEYNNWYSYYYNDSNLSVISIILYRYNYIIFIIISIILLVAMVGVIILTSSKTLNIKEQNIYEQTFRFIKKRKDEYKNK